ncbi:MAG: hypothetical protein Q8922_10765 [Bacteroidota bacterium]|nr:hypothetical protein [Bacteroidota bacterium]MDP4232671.1 hypothetical protein [Bacteroidota bacterium]MDP4243196.1 hypothetical protein [Bacteroidota bacterium]MDP4288408.1 hypothetical protein [Bacteroidota bacterium]
MAQSLHPDFETTLPDTDYFFLGSGTLQAAIQWSRHPGATRLGLLIADPDQFARKWSTHLYHPEYGLSKTTPTLILDGVRYQPDETLQVVWYPDRLPGVTAMWQAGDVYVIERFVTSVEDPVLIREYTIGTDREFESIELEVALYANPALYDEFVGNDTMLGARGYESLLVRSFTSGVFHERTLRFPLERTEGMYQATIYYSLGDDPVLKPNRELLGKEVAYWEQCCARWTDANPSPLIHEIERVFSASAQGLRAAITMDGRFDASIWQYGYEWSGDASIACEAAVYSGQFEVARSVLANILTRLTISEGMAVESSRFRGGKDAELNNNGEILKACRTYLEWTGDRELIEAFYPRIQAIADYLLRPEYLNEETGLLMASRDIWERGEAMGILPGYDVSHQTFGILGLRDASWIAKQLDREDDRSRWSATAKRMRQSFLEHPTHSMIESGRIIKRRLLDGSIQTELTLANINSEFQKQFVPDGMPLASKGARIWEPDVSECFPICFGVVDPKSDVAKTTLDALDALWSQSWEGGGYGRYNVLSEPDSPGPWPFATMFMAAASLEAGNVMKAQRAINWLIERAGAGASWFEFYGDRPTPPLPPTGIVVWAWAQWITLVVKHLLVARVENDQLIITPRLGGFFGELRFRDSSVPIPNPASRGRLL